MPSIQDLNAFKNAVNQLGSEPDVVQARDEALEDIQPDESTLPLMPELSVMQEAIEQKNQEDEVQEEIGPVENEALDEQLSEIVMNDDALEEQERITQEETFLEEQIDDEALYPLPEEFDELFNDSLDTEEDVLEPEETQAQDNVTDDVANVELDEQIPEDTTAAAETVPQSVYEMLDTGFGELDSERLSAEILNDEDIEDITPEEPEEIETPPVITEEETEEPTESEEEPPVFADTEDLPTELDEDELNAWDNLDDVEDLEENIPEDISSYNDDVNTYDGEDAPAQQPSLSAHENILHLEEALKEHRSGMDLLSINEDETEQEDNEYEELQFSISHDNARNFSTTTKFLPDCLENGN